ncbi:sensor histidine kinase [Streptomyces sp. NBC_01217]|uniref:sensor histidine kinase n=1 Tax=Streptomyces sp. NBC_01217 TaxID=2903779 RepID=UPI002E0F7331|nr:histidine kinase [Streptomyces sp. NBC_01217]
MARPETAPAAVAARLPQALTEDPTQRVTVSIIKGLAAWRMADETRPRLRRWGVPVMCVLLGLPAVLASGNRSHLPVELALTLALTLPLVWREQRPVLVFTLATAVSLAALPLGVLNGADAARVVALYNVGRYGTPRQLAVASTVTAAHLAVWATVFWGSGHLQHAKRPEMMTLLAMLAVTACAGLALTGRLAKAYIVALESEREQQTRLAAAQERARVSREMHDVLGHTLAVIVGLADGAAALAATRPERSANALGIIADSGRDALAELRRLLIVVDPEPAPTEGHPLAPQPGLADLDALMERVGAAGPTVARQTSGSLASLSSGVQLTVYRIVQEALTNTIKHAAPDTTVTVTLTAGADRVDVTVEDTGPPRTAPSHRPANGEGRGLLGIRERAALYQGHLTAGPTHSGGWRLHTVLTPHRSLPTTAPKDPSP